jgi:hypothetical protein
MDAPPSVVGRLLQEISWGGNARPYREGGRGLENVLSAEVFQALDFLPRDGFLGRIVRSARGGAPEACGLLADQIENATLDLLPGDVFLSEYPPAGEGQLYIQPDAIIRTPDVYCLLEAKRIRRGSFQPEQLAREYLAVLQEAGDKTPLLLLVLPSEPPVAVRSNGRKSLHDAVAQWLEPVLARVDSELPSAIELVAQIDSVVASTTWDEVSKCVADGLAELDGLDTSVGRSMSRLAASVQSAIEWHS